MKTTITKNTKNKNLSKHNIIATNNTPQAKSYKHIFYKPRVTTTKSLKRTDKRRRRRRVPPRFLYEVPYVGGCDHKC